MQRSIAGRKQQARWATPPFVLGVGIGATDSLGEVR
jgi:hypothetical protein